VERTACGHCGQQLLVGRQRKYCDLCSPLASLLWKRRHRRLWKAAGDPYWLTDWKHKTSDERRTYFRDYMRAYRRQQRNPPAMSLMSDAPEGLLVAKGRND